MGHLHVWFRLKSEVKSGLFCLFQLGILQLLGFWFVISGSGLKPEHSQSWCNSWYPGALHFFWYEIRALHLSQVCNHDAMNQRLGCNSKSRGHIMKNGESKSSGGLEDLWSSSWPCSNAKVESVCSLVSRTWGQRFSLSSERARAMRTTVVRLTGSLLPSWETSWKGKSHTPSKPRFLISYHWHFGLAQGSLIAILGTSGVSV